MLAVNRVITSELARIKVEDPNNKHLLLYQSIATIICLSYASKINKDILLEALNNFTRYALQFYTLHPRFAALFANKYFRNLYTEALHLYWQAEPEDIAKDLSLLNDLAGTNTAFRELREKLKQNRDNRPNAKNIARSLRKIMLLKKFEADIASKLTALNSRRAAEDYREIAFQVLDWLPALADTVERKVIINILLQIAVYFKTAAACPGPRNIRITDEKLAANILFTAATLSKSETPDVELYTLTHVVKYFYSFEFGDEHLKYNVESLQKRALYLANIYPFFEPVSANIVILFQGPEFIILLRTFLQVLLEISKLDPADKNPVWDHEHVVVLYQVYEACLRNWYKDSFSNDTLAKELRFELMQKLLAKHNWSINDLRRNVDSPWLMINRDSEGWIIPQNFIPFPEHEAIQRFKSLNAVTMNKKTGHIEFIFDPLRDDEAKFKGALTVYDLIEMLEKNIQIAFFSLDPVDGNMHYHPFNVMRFGPENIYRTQFFNSMLITDYLLKFFTVNQEVQARDEFKTRPLDNLLQNLPGFLKKILYDFHKGASQESMHRFWIEAVEVPTILQDGDEDSDLIKLRLDNVKMVVRKHAMKIDTDGNLVDKDEDNEGWAVHLYDERQREELQQGRISISGSAIICIKGSENIYFYEKGTLSAACTLPTIPEIQKLQDLHKFPCDENHKIIVDKVGDDVAYRVYRFVKNATERTSRPHNYSKEFIFAQEFTANYNAFAIYFPEFGRLRELSRVAAFIQLLNRINEGNKKQIQDLEAKLNDEGFWEEIENEITTKISCEIRRDVQQTIRGNNDLLRSDQSNKRSLIYSAFLTHCGDREEYSKAIDAILKFDAEPMAAIITRSNVTRSILENKKFLREKIAGLQQLDREFDRLGMKDEEVNVSGKCLWVPANISHSIIHGEEHTSTRTTYGGVRVAPVINFLQRGTPQYSALSSQSRPQAVAPTSYLAWARQVQAAAQGGTSTRQFPAHVYMQEAVNRARATASAPAPAPTRATAAGNGYSGTAARTTGAGAAAPQTRTSGAPAGAGGFRAPTAAPTPQATRPTTTTPAGARTFGFGSAAAMPAAASGAGASRPQTSSGAAAAAASQTRASGATAGASGFRAPTAAPTPQATRPTTTMPAGARTFESGPAAARSGTAAAGATSGASGPRTGGGCNGGTADGGGGSRHGPEHSAAQAHVVEGTGIRAYSMCNAEVRAWYHSQLDLIPTKIDMSLPPRERGLLAFQLRNEIKMQARELMSDRAVAETLPTEKKLSEAVRSVYNGGEGATGDELWDQIMGKSTKSNETVDQACGLQRK
ncbi:MAG: hypothetical protein KBD25_00190 [Rickettsiaceae bacterium]|nr:hypothetical protein [Rickettsiaceae bacterium]